jgi:hypothetical protein
LGITLTVEPGVAEVPSATGTAKSETGTISEVLEVRAGDSEVFGDSAKTIDVEVGSRIPKEISSEFQTSFIGRFLEMAMEYLMQPIGQHYSEVLSLYTRSLRRVFTLYLVQLSKLYKKLFQLARNLYPSAFICVHLRFQWPRARAGDRQGE